PTRLACARLRAQGARYEFDPLAAIVPSGGGQKLAKTFASCRIKMAGPAHRFARRYAINPVPSTRGAFRRTGRPGWPRRRLAQSAVDRPPRPGFPGQAPKDASLHPVRAAGSTSGPIAAASAVGRPGRPPPPEWRSIADAAAGPIVAIGCELRFH